MTDKKFKQEDIINALECCIKDDAKYCDDCSYYDEEDEHEQLCVYRLHRDTLDLIARLKARNNQYLLKNTNQRHTLAMLNKQVAELKEELDGKDVEIMRLKHEIERLTLENLQMIASIKNLKSEAIKEFAERLKEPYKDYDKNVGVVGKTALFNDIDNLVKEMTEGGAK